MIIQLTGLILAGLLLFKSINPKGPNFSSQWVNSILNQIQEPRLLIALFVILLATFLIQFILLKRKQTNYGYARFAQLRDIKKINFINQKKKGLLLGKFKNKLLFFENYLSLMCFAPPGSGKTAGIVIPNLLFIDDRSIVANDPKGELFEATSKFRSNFSKILVFDPLNKLNVPSEYRARYNLLETNENNSLSDFYLKLSRCAGVFFQTGEKEDPHWNNRSKSLFIVLGLYAFNKYPKNQISVPLITTLLSKIISGQEKVLSDDPFDDDSQDDEGSNAIFFMKTYMEKLIDDKEMLATSEAEIKDYDLIIEAFSDFADAEEKEFKSVLSTFSSNLMFAKNPVIRESLVNSNFTATNLRKRLTTIYIIVAQEDKDILAPVMRALTEDLTRAFLSKMPEKQEQGVLFLLDEVAMMGKLEQVIEAPALSRGFGFHFFFIAQSINQLNTIYSQDKTKAILGTIGVQYVLTQNSNDDAKEISEYAGDLTRTKESGQKKGIARLFSKSQKDDINESDEGFKLITPQDVRSLKQGEAFLFVQGFFHRPIKLTTPYYEKLKFLKKRVGSILD